MKYNEHYQTNDKTNDKKNNKSDYECAYKYIKFLSRRSCHECKGTGFKSYFFLCCSQLECDKCNGEGYL